MRPPRKARLAGWGLAGALALLPLAGCKQGVGQRCQIDSDCQSGLTCNAGTQLCQQPGGMGVDSGMLPDGLFVPDAAPDAGQTDAAPSAADAAPTDAAPTDAALTDAM